MHNLFRPIISASIIAVGISFATAQAPTPKPTATPKPAATPKATPQPTPPPVQKLDLKNLNVDQVVELSIIYYGTRDRMNQIRKTTLEHGLTTLTAADGQVQRASYQRSIIRGDSLAKEKIRLDQEFPTARYALVFNDEKIFGIFNNTVFSPTDVAVKTFENQIAHGLEALLRYKENGSTLAMASREKILGVDYYVVDVTDKEQRKTRFYVSAKTFRVMMLSYEDGGVKYRRRFYDYNYAQGTLVPFRSVLWADDKIVEETEVGTVTFGQKVDPALFSAS